MLLEPEEMREAGLHETPVGGVRNDALHCLAELVHRRRPVLAFENVRAPAHHLGKCPVGDTFSIRQAATAMPAKLLLESVHVLEEFPAQARLADPRDPGNLDEVGLAVVGTGEEEVLDQLELTVAADKGRLETLRLHQAADARDDPVCLPETHGFDLSFQFVQAGIAILDRRVGCSLGGLADQDRARHGGRLDARRRIDEITRDHPLSGRAEVHRCLTGEHSRPSTQLRRTRLDAELGHGVDDFERCANGAL